MVDDEVLNAYELEAGQSLKCFTCRHVFIKTVGPGLAGQHRSFIDAAGISRCVCTICNTCLALEALRA